MPGIPVGPGTVFYLLAAIAMPFVGTARRFAGRRNPHSPRPLSRQVSVAVGMALTGALSFWVFDRIGHLVDGRHRGSGTLLLSSPLIVALVVLVLMTAIGRLLRSVARARSRA
jgi:hypothetical protein